ncbi:hypothetical protein ASPZODRAFT_17860 [Penicilliopsis zonata CBS 506.65]|uniref:Ribonuclease P/MRP protein subunit POP5 n=1 Tax=Penicilliopsis zonata CBS 506.65 TaxID=1073090 RepID=A0A1L9SCU5_9EURO|nr:hypothetical protein ASPZODRAFT_17860 [Penicilliopsis zonata CBS 506.65]OJJ44948.1 hypothetical protein ASPZODRAFT_17860 [Penicilliopsis zonata CBS 506.65]
MVRVKHRYLLLDILYPSTSTKPSSTSSSNRVLSIHAPTPDTLTPGLLAKMVREEVAEIFGDWGVGRLGGAGAGGISVKYLSPATSTAIIRCPRASFRLVWTALTYMTHVPEGRDAARPCVFRVVRVSGTIRKAEEEAIRRARREIVRLRGLDEAVFGVLGGDAGRKTAGGSGTDSAVLGSPVDGDDDEDMDDDDDDY